jgi:hypothetical protein
LTTCSFDLKRVSGSVVSPYPSEAFPSMVEVLSVFPPGVLRAARMEPAPDDRLDGLRDDPLDARMEPGGWTVPVSAPAAPTGVSQGDPPDGRPDDHSGDYPVASCSDDPRAGRQAYCRVAWCWAASQGDPRADHSGDCPVASRTVAQGDPPGDFQVVGYLVA